MSRSAYLRRKTALTVACPSCFAPVDEPCRNLRSTHRNPIDTPHQVRLDAAGYASRRRLRDLNPDPIRRVEERSTARILSDPAARVPKCSVCRQIAAFCDCPEGPANTNS